MFVSGHPIARLVLVFTLALVGSAGATTTLEDLLTASQTQIQAGQLDQALASLQQAIAADPRSSLAHTRLGGLYLLRQEYRAGIQSFQQAISLDPRDGDAFVGLAIAYLHLGNHGPARAALQQAASLKPERRAEIDRLLAWLDQRARSRP